MPILKKHLPCHDQLEYASQPSQQGQQVAPKRWRFMEPDFDWTCTAARSRRLNNRCPGYESFGTDLRVWNSGYFAAVLISPCHALCCGHYRRAVPSQASSLRFIGRTGVYHYPTLKRVVPDVGMDLDLLEFEDNLPNDVAVLSRIADMRNAKRGAPMMLQTSQHMSVQCLLDKVVVIQETGGATWAKDLYIKPVLNGVDDFLTDSDGDPVTFSGDSGSPLLSLDRDGYQCLVGFFAGGGAIGVGGSKWPGDAFDVINLELAKRGHQVHQVELGGAPLRFSADANGDGTIDASDVAAVLTHWGGKGEGDVNRDGTVDAADLAETLAGWKV